MDKDNQRSSQTDGLSPTPPDAPKTPSTRGRRQIGFQLPTLHIPPPNVSSTPEQLPYSANVQSARLSVPGSDISYQYPRKASEFMFTQLHGLKDITKSGLGLGEKLAYWLYNKVSSLSRNWFTHIFLSIVIILYTVGGAAMFVAVEGK